MDMVGCVLRSSKWYSTKAQDQTLAIINNGPKKEWRWSPASWFVYAIRTMYLWNPSKISHSFYMSHDTTRSTTWRLISLASQPISNRKNTLTRTSYWWNQNASSGPLCHHRRIDTCAKSGKVASVTWPPPCPAHMDCRKRVPCSGIEGSWGKNILKCMTR